MLAIGCGSAYATASHCKEKKARMNNSSRCPKGSRCSEGEANTYGADLYGEKFKKYGYGQEIPKDALFVHSRVLPDSTKRNVSSREANRVKAKDPGLLPTFTFEQFKKLSDEEGKTVASFRGGVYDLSPFVKAHPGGDRILMANGNDLEVFWNVYKLHFRPHIQHLGEVASDILFAHEEWDFTYSPHCTGSYSSNSCETLGTAT